MELIQFTVKGIAVEFDRDLVSPETRLTMEKKGYRRAFFERQTPEKKPGDLAAAIAKVKKDPNTYYGAVIREGVSRPKMTPLEREARNFFSTFLAAAKAGDADCAKVWKAAGGVSFKLTAGKEESAEVKAVVEKNQAARAKIIAAKVRIFEKAAPKIDLSGLQ